VYFIVTRSVKITSYNIYLLANTDVEALLIPFIILSLVLLSVPLKFSSIRIE